MTASKETLDAIARDKATRAACLVAVEAIAVEVLGRDLVERRSDSLDFKEHGPNELLRALVAAYDAGRQSLANDIAERVNASRAAKASRTRRKGR